MMHGHANRERRTLSVPTISYEHVDDAPPGSPFTGGSPQGLSTLGAGPGRPNQAPMSAGHGQLSASTLTKPQHMNRSRSASTSSVSTPTGATAKKKIVTACQRCRTRKIRCDGALPACKSCVKAGVDCIEVDRSGDHNMPRSHVLELENRIKWLEEIVSTRCPDVDLASGPPVELRSNATPPAIRIVTTGPDFDNPQQQQAMSNTSSPVFAISPASTCATPASFEFSSPAVSPGYHHRMSPFTFSDSGPSPTPSPGPSSPLLQAQDTLSHEVGLLSLSVSEEPKYVGPSSGVNFARLILSSAESDEASVDNSDNWLRDVKPQIAAPPAMLPSAEECLMLSKTYFETVHVQYPFLHRPTFEMCLDIVINLDTKSPELLLPSGYTLAIARFQSYLVLSIGATVFSARVGQPFNSDGYYAAALQSLDGLSLTGSLQGAQCALLLAIWSLYAPGGYNVWYLNAIIMATCVDLGFQRKIPPVPGVSDNALKRRVFWCAYALDRNIAIALGRPYGLRDDGFDVGYPEEMDNDEELTARLSGVRVPSIAPSIATSRANFTGSIYLFRVTLLLSSIHTTLYRLPSAPQQAPELAEWQSRVFQQLNEVREQAATVLRSSSSLVDLKYHEAVQLLFRPSPVFPRPSLFALQQIFTSATETIRIYTKLKRFGELPYTRLTAHSVFLSGITMLYGYRTQNTTSAESFSEDVSSCSDLLDELAHRWPVAQKSRVKYEQVARMTLSTVSSQRMLSPHDGTRRSTFVQEQPMLDAPGWFGGGIGPGAGGVTGGNVLPQHDLSWIETMDQEWTDLPMVQGADQAMEDMLVNVLMDDTAMWGTGQ